MRKGENAMRILVIDGQGGRIGRALVEELRRRGFDGCITAVGTNSIATAAMLKAGADEGATGENPVIVQCRTAGVIAGPIGITLADAMLGEVSPRMAAAVGQSAAPMTVPYCAFSGTRNLMPKFCSILANT